MRSIIVCLLIGSLCAGPVAMSADEIRTEKVRNAARRNEVAKYTLELKINGGGGAAADAKNAASAFDQTFSLLGISFHVAARTQRRATCFISRFPIYDGNGSRVGSSNPSGTHTCKLCDRLTRSARRGEGAGCEVAT